MKIKYSKAIIQGLITAVVFVGVYAAIGQLSESNRLKVLLAKHGEAMGGKKNWNGLKSYRQTSKRANGLSVTMECLMPNKIRYEFRKDSMHVIKSFDGKHGFLVRNGVYKSMRPGEKVEMAEEPSYYSELIFADEKDVQIDYLGEEEILGVNCAKISLTKSNKDQQTYWLNLENYLIEQTGEYSEDKAHEGVYFTTRLSDYRNVNGMMFPFKQQLIPGDREAVDIVIEDLIVDLEIDSIEFSFMPNSTENLIRYWKDRYTDEQLKGFTFVQETIRFRENEAPDTSTWYEAIEYPDRFRMDFGDKEKGNRNLYRNDSIYVLRGFEMVHADQEIQEFMLLEGSLYASPVDTTIAKIKQTGVDPDRFDFTNYKGRDCYIVGAEIGDEHSPQVWLDTERRSSVRRFMKTQNGNLLEVRYDDFQYIDGHWIESWLEFYMDGQLIQTERYNDIEVEPDLDDRVFDPTGFKESYWYE